MYISYFIIYLLLFAPMSPDKSLQAVDSNPDNNSNSTEDGSSDFSLELVVGKPKEDEKQAESAIDANIYDFDLDTIKDKPWLKPGADITDYFNYGFSEKSWKKYCEMQRENRAFTESRQERNYKETRYESRTDERYYKRRRLEDERYRNDNGRKDSGRNERNESGRNDRRY